jgi:hypothetical protein
MLAPFTHVIKGDEAHAAAEAPPKAVTAEAAFAATATTPEAPKKKLAVRIRKADAAPL